MSELPKWWNDRNNDSIEFIEWITGFDELKQYFEKNKTYTEFLDNIWDYIELSLDNLFSKQEKNNIKLVLLWEIQNGLDLDNLTKNTLDNILWPLSSLISEWNSKSNFWEKIKNSKEELNKLGNKIKNIFSNLWLDWKIEKISEKIKKINEAKKWWNSVDINSLSWVSRILWINNNSTKSEKDIFEEIKQKSILLASNFSSWETIAIQVKNGLNNLPFNLWNTILEYMKWLVKELPIIWLLFSVFLGKDFLSESWDKYRSSTNNLIKYSSENDFPLKNNIKLEELKKLNPEELKKFYSFLDNKKIDYSSDNFWKELLTWKSKNETIIELNKILQNKDGYILTNNDKLDDLLKKLNNLPKAFSIYTIKETSKKRQLNQSVIEESKIKIENISQRIETQRQEIQEMEWKSDTSEQELEQKRQELKQKEKQQKILIEQNKKAKEEQQRLDFEKSIFSIKSMPATIHYKWKILELNIMDNHISLWSDSYSISIIAWKYWEKFEKIEFIDGNIILNWELSDPIWKEEILKVIDDLLSKWEYNFSWVKDKGFFIWEVSYVWKIKKI